MSVIKSKLSPVSIPEGISLHKFILDRAKRHGNKTAFVSIQIILLCSTWNIGIIQI